MRVNTSSSTVSFLVQITALTLALLLATFTVSTARTQEVVDTSYSYSFGQTATFSVSFADGAPDEATLYLRLNDERTTSHAVEVHEGVAEYRRNLGEEPFLPFARVTYRWDFTPVDSGTPTSSPPTTFIYMDNRFEWESIASGNVTLHWITGTTEAMLAAQDIARTSLDEIQNALQPSTAEGVTIYIYPSSADLQSALRLAGHSWIAGHAYPEVDVVLLAISPTERSRATMARYIPHELTHNVIHDVVGQRGYTTQPAWFIEGLASLFERSPDPAYALALEDAEEKGGFIPLQNLCATFPLEHSDVVLAYAQSQSFVTYLRESYGMSRLRALLGAYADGMGCSAGLERTVGEDLLTLEREWKVWLAQDRRPTTDAIQWRTEVMIVLRELAPWLVLALLIVLPGTAYFVDGYRGR